jgi:hypothetical protein
VDASAPFAGEPRAISKLASRPRVSAVAVLKTNALGTLLLLAVVMFGITACSSARINGMQPPAPMSRDVERQHIQDEGIEFCKRYPDDVACQRKAQ